MATDTLPAIGQSWRDIEHRLTRFESTHLEVRQGFMDRYWPAYPAEVYLGARDAASRFAYANMFSLRDLPALQCLERELRAMIGDVLHVPTDGAVTLTSGGTESNFLAVKGARARGLARGITEPNVVIPMTAHPSFDKAGDELRVEVRRVPVTREYRACVSGTSDAIDSDTVMLVGSAPSYPQGVVDPITDLAGLATSRDVWFHVDSCVGGYLVPFLIELGESVPEFRFDVEGVWSISADLHKFGYALNGISSLAVRDSALQDLHTFRLGEQGWHYRPYARIGFGGSRPGAVIASAWATMQVLGRSGYLAIADSIRKSATRIAEAVVTIPGLDMIAPPEAGIAVIAVSSDLDAEAVSAELLARGWDIPTGESPPTLHILLDPHPDELVERFLADLRDATTLVAGGSATAARTSSYGD